MKPSASSFVEWAFIALPVLVFVAVWFLHARALARRRKPASSVAVGAGLFLWLWVAAGLALSGLLSRFDLRPPPFGVLIVFTLALACAFGLSRNGAVLSTLPLSWLVGLQTFRFPLEIVMHQAMVEGVMPVQMSYSGRNFDIVTGVTALLLAPAIAKGLAPRWMIVAWNVMGAILLANVVTIAMISTPAVHAFGTEPAQLNTFVAFFPFVWLPTALVSTALAFHIIIARALRRAPDPAV